MKFWDIEKVKERFNTKGTGNTICFSLVCWTDGMWSIKVTDDWHRWLDEGIKSYPYKHTTAEQAIRGFLNYLDLNGINPNKLQESLENVNS